MAKTKVLTRAQLICAFVFASMQIASFTTGNHVIQKEEVCQRGKNTHTKKLNDSCKIGFAISVNTGQICLKFEADTSGNI